jgi:rubrerythrin
MPDRQTTASAIISFSQELEGRASAFYRALAQAFPQHEAMFLGFAEESDRNETLLTRTYRETVSDALETGFAFEGLDLEEYASETGVAANTSLGDAVTRAKAMEDSAIAFYRTVAEQSRSLLATIPSAFRRVARRRDERRRTLESLSAQE